MMITEKRHYNRARNDFIQAHIGPAKALLEATTTLVNLATSRAEATKKTLEELRPVWAQGWTSDSQAAQASSAALGQLWKMLGVDNQTAAVEELQKLIESSPQ